jgi:RNA-directed DNA polymerase
MKHLEVRTWFRPEIDAITVGSRLAQSPNDLATRLQGSTCEACGTTTGPFEMHHVRRLKDLRAGPD